MFLQICGVAFLISVLSYLLPALWPKFFKEQDLKKRYPAATWGLVTGGSSGIGKAIVTKLAQQGFNVVVLAIPDKTLDDAVEEFEKKFPNLKFIKIGVDLSLKDCSYMESIKAKTKDVDVSLVFNNAGYLKTGFYVNNSFEQQLANHNTNCTSVTAITHHFVSEMSKKKLKGCVCFTSSPAGFMPCPFSVSYGATKSFLTQFALSIAPEIGPEGIDVCVLHPSPVNSNFYARKDMIAIDTLVFMQKQATTPENVAESLFQCIGRSLVCDQGWYTFMVRLLLKLVDINFIASLITRFGQYSADFKKAKNTK